jgi:hypothetical protein
MNNISINDNWHNSVLITVSIILLLITAYHSFDNSDSSAPVIVTQSKNIL